MSRFPSYHSSHGGPPDYSSNLASQTLSDRGIRNMYALIIGINQYADSRNYPTLHGCVTDGQSVVEYLRSRLFVPQENIHYLYDSAATHAAIIREIECFGRGNPRRGNDGDPILVYYAGHGGERPPPSQSFYRQNEKIQVLIPYDCGIRDGAEICAIPDYIIGDLLKNIADRIGNNITVIFDCCHSASSTRSGDPAADSAIRGVKYRGQLPSLHILDQSDLANRTRGVHVAPSYTNGGLRSHVLLAACQAGELAREEQKRGVFTVALLDALYKIDPNDMGNVTYRDLLKRIPQLRSQNPQCEGDFQDRFIFQITKACKTNPLFFGWVSSTAGILHIQGGQANRINKDDGLDIWRSERDHTNRVPPVGRVKVVAVRGPSESEAHNTVALSANSRFVCEVVISRHTPDLLLYVDPRLIGVEQALARVVDAATNQHMAKFKRAPRDIARISFSLSPDGQKCFLQLNDSDMNRRGLTTIPHSVSLGDNVREFSKVLHAIAVYEYYLRHVELLDLKRSGFSLELSRLFWNSQTAEFRDQNQNLNDSQFGVDIKEDNSFFVIKIINRTPYPVYPALFYFDNCDFSIECLYQPPSAGNHQVDPPLKPYQTLTIGNGSQGLAPFEVHIRSPRAFETGYLKLFISSTYTEFFSHIEHKSPFNPRHTRALVQHPWKQPDLFGSFMVPFVVRRNQSTRGVYQPHTPSSFKDSSDWGTVFRTSAGYAQSSQAINELSTKVQETEYSLQELEGVIPELERQQTRSTAQLERLWGDLERLETATSQW